jgi:hypothetical protein
VEGFRINLPKTVTPDSHPLVHLAYWHVRLLAYLFSPSSLSSDLLWVCKESVGLLVASPHLVSPLNQHFTCLAGLCAAELSKVERTQDDAAKHVAPSAWDAAIRDKIGETTRAAAAATSTAEATTTTDRNLQRLANLAAATTAEVTKANAAGDSVLLPVRRRADNYEDAGFDPRPMLRSGYLNLIAPLDPALAL